MYIKWKKKARIGIVGFFFSLMITLFLWSALARVLYDIIEISSDLSNNMILFFIIIGLLFISLVSSIIVSFLIIDDVSKLTLVKTAIASYSITFLLIIAVSYVYFIVFHFDLLVAIEPVWKVAFIFPALIVNFSLYAFEIPFIMFIFAILVYYLLFLGFIEKFYMYSPKYEKNYREMENELKLRGF